MNRWEFSHGIVGVNAPSWLTYEVHRPYFDGAESPATVIQARSAVLAARRFENPSPGALRFGMTMPASYRRLLVQESRLTAYRATVPTDLPDELASPAWRRMTGAYRRHAELDQLDRSGLAHWLVAVCLPAAVLEVVPEDLDPAACQDQVTAAVQAARAAALFGSEGLSERTTAAYRVLADHPAPTVAHVQAVAGWGYLLARHAGDDSAAPLFLGRARELLKDIAGELTRFTHTVLTARLALREVMYAERQRDFGSARALLADVRASVAELTAPDGDDELVLLETRRRLLDRHLEIAVRTGDTEAERAAVEEGVALDPWDVKIRMQAAQAHERAGEHEQALAGYLHAARLGPFGTGFALLRAADRARELGHTEFARVLNERAFRAAPRAGATRDALLDACRRDGDRPLAELTERAATRDRERPYANNWHYRMYASYFNLGESESPGLYARLPSLAYEFAERGGERGAERAEVNWQRLMPPAFRGNLIRESGLTEFAVDHPADLPEHLRTPRWNRLCEWLDDFGGQGPERQQQVAMVLYRLGFAKLVLELIPAVPVDRLRTPAELRLHHWRDLVRYVASVGTRVAAPETSFAIAEHPACPTNLRFVIAVVAVVFHARETRSLEEATRWREIGARALEELLAEPDRSPFEKMMAESRFYRSVSFVPFLAGDRGWLARDMDRAEELARAVPAEGPYQEFLKRENLRACVESRSKECYAFGEDERGDRLVAEALALDPYEPKTHIEVAEGLLRRDLPREAADSYLRTARLGPVSTAFGYASAGECFRRAGRPVLAEDCFLQALRLDPYAISAARGWAAVGAANGMGELARTYLADLEAWGAARLAARRERP
ncbi:tetratricopeptide repeat protein [Kitasatospora aureofaciens]|uniref:tetratricopeptide repeat protein n=1 Tax=Kitasatospora aureofaciens TaxID=1894 RepID=UPI0004C03687